MYRQNHNIRHFVEQAGTLALVEVSSIHGSAPRNAGAWMLVGSTRTFNTIGGGQLEKLAIEKARNLIITQDDETQTLQIPLGPQIGQCCGGAVNLRLSLLDKEETGELVSRHEEQLAGMPHVYVFGAGHVGRAMSEAFLLLPVNPVLVDSRSEELALAPANVETRLSAIPEEHVKTAPPGSSFVILTHDHSQDFLIAQQALQRHDAAFIGMIGSKTKRATFRNWLRRETGSEEGFERLTCPIGKKSSDKRPEVIAALTVAEIMRCLPEDHLQLKHGITFNQEIQTQ